MDRRCRKRQLYIAKPIIHRVCNHGQPEPLRCPNNGEFRVCTSQNSTNINNVELLAIGPIGHDDNGVLLQRELIEILQLRQEAERHGCTVCRKVFC